MKNYILLSLLILLCSPSYSQKIAKSRQPLKKVGVHNVKTVADKNTKKIGQELPKQKIYRRDNIKAKKSVERRIDPPGAKRASNAR